MLKTEHRSELKSMDILALDAHALESLFHNDRENSLSKLLTSIGSHLRNYVDSFREYIRDTSEDSSAIRKDITELKSRLDKVNYINIREQMVAIPEGYTGINYLEYLNELLTLVRSSDTVTSNLCAEYKKLIDVIAVNGSDKVLMTDYQKLYSDATTHRDLILSTLHKFFTDSHVAIGPIKNVLSSLSEINKYDSYVFELVNNSKPETLNKLSKEVEEIHTSLDVLLANISKHSVVIHGPDIVDIGQGAYALAQYMEAIGLLYYNIVVAINRVHDLVTMLLTESYR